MGAAACMLASSCGVTCLLVVQHTPPMGKYVAVTVSFLIIAPEPDLGFDKKIGPGNLSGSDGIAQVLDLGFHVKPRHTV